MKPKVHVSQRSIPEKAITEMLTKAIARNPVLVRDGTFSALEIPLDVTSGITEITLRNNLYTLINARNAEFYDKTGPLKKELQECARYHVILIVSFPD